MNFDKKQTRPVSTRALLRKQVEEQSTLCDYTVKNELWSKRYHASVVCESPFIQSILTHNFEEKAKGFLELKLFSKESIDMAMMFFYGKAPRLTMDNVSQMMHLAEFLLVPNLKAFCVKWITKTTVDEENVEMMLHLTSLFDFEMPKLPKYIRQHLPELLGGNKLLSITSDTIENMFSDATLSYVNADVRFEFAMRWVEHFPEQRKPKLTKIVEGIELPEVNADLLKRAKGNKLFENLHTFFESEAATAGKVQSVWITNLLSTYGEFIVFDYGKDRWYKLEGSPRYLSTEQFAYASGESILCLVKKTSKKCVISLYDFSVLDEISRTSVRLISSPEIRVFESIYISDKVCYAVLNDQVTITVSETVIRQRKREQRLHLMAMSRGPIHLKDDFEIIDSERTYTSRRPTLCVGAISKCSDTTFLTPLLSLNVSFDVHIVVNEVKLVAFFSRNPKFFCIYDEQSCKMENIDICLDENDEISPFKEGFALYNRMKIRFIIPRTSSRGQGPFLVCGTFLKDRNDACTYRVVKNKWVRFCTANFYDTHSEAKMEYTIDELDKVNVRHVGWKHIPDLDDFEDESTICNFQEIAIPRIQLKCNLKCPHCIRIQHENRYKLRTCKYRFTQKDRDWSTDDDDDEDYDTFGYDGEDYYYDSDGYC